MAEYLRLARLYMLILAVVAGGRWVQGNLLHVPYERGTDRLSIVITTLMASIFYAAFTRRWLGYSILQATGLAMTLGVIAQLVIFLSTFVSYGLGIDSYFNHPRALNRPEAVGFAEAMGIRTVGLVQNTILDGIAGAVGWAVGVVLPARPK